MTMNTHTLYKYYITAKHATHTGGLLPTFLPHSSLYAFLEAAVLAPVTGVFLDGTGAAASACVAGVGSNAAAKEALAGLAAEDAEMVA